uniref:DUF1618 domain-containing protein n=1 Tax=Oryza punctata TaxID=4537 RepID=A0A0E0LVP1_ORYPU
MPANILDGDKERYVFTLLLYKSTTNTWQSKHLDLPDGPHDTDEALGKPTPCSPSIDTCAGATTTVASYVLRGFEWEVDVTLQLEEELWPLPSYQESPLRRITPMFLVFSMLEANVLHFILDRPGYSDKCWVITIDMKNKSLGPYTLYMNAAEQDCDEDGSSNIFCDRPMISTDLTKFLKNTPVGG